MIAKQVMIAPQDPQPILGKPYASAQRLKRVFAIDVETCSVCSGSMKVIACIDDPWVIRKILTRFRAMLIFQKVIQDNYDIESTAQMPVSVHSSLWRE